MSLQLTSLIITLLVTGFTIPLLLSRIKMMSLNYHKLNLGHYEKIKELCGKDARDNLCELRVALAYFTNKKLTPVEIEWFIYIPGAFFYLKKFGRCLKYLDIDTNENKFIWSAKFQSRTSRFFEQLKIFMVYLVTGTFGVSIILAYETLYKVSGIVPTIFSLVIAVILCGAAFLSLWALNIIGDSKQLLKVEMSY